MRRWRIRRKGGAWGKWLNRQTAIIKLRGRLKKYPGPYRISWRGRPDWSFPRSRAATIARLRKLAKAQPDRFYQVETANLVVFNLVAEENIVVEIVPRHAWGARAPKYKSTMSGAKSLFFVHHTADSGPAALTSASKAAFMRSIQNFHMDSRGWSDIAYSFVLFDDGTVYEGRGWGVQGGHTLGYNSSSHAGCAAGNYMAKKAPDALIAAYNALLDLGHKSGHVPQNPDVKGHRQVGATACPGDNLYARVGEIK